MPTPEEFTAEDREFMQSEPFLELVRLALMEHVGLEAAELFVRRQNFERFRALVLHGARH